MTASRDALSRADIRAEADRFLTFFTSAGAERMEAEILLPAETLLDLYGEDIRARAFVTRDDLGRELMMRPDFTVPVAQLHMEQGAAPARYTYSGPVFRKQNVENARAAEYMQVGFEVFDRGNPAKSDAEVFHMMSSALAPFGLRAATGDLGVALAAIAGLNTTERRRAALIRHIWRPERFQFLLDKFSQAPTKWQEPVRGGVEHIGLRTPDQIETRLAELKEDGETDPLPRHEIEALNALFEIKDKMGAAISKMHALVEDLPSIDVAIDRVSARADALSDRGLDAQGLDFEVRYGRTTLEYYDGFVFGFYAADRPELPAVASGGRYDALTSVLGNGQSIPAVGGVIRPELALALKRGRT
jgi:ATP phosphoribosyltransferase regulatory subunit